MKKHSDATLFVACILSVFAFAFMLAYVQKQDVTKNVSNPFAVTAAYGDTLSGNNLLPLSFTASIGDLHTSRDTISAMDSVVFSTSTDLFTGINGKGYQKVTGFIEIQNFSVGDTLQFGGVFADSLDFGFVFPGKTRRLQPIYLTVIYYKALGAGSVNVSTIYSLPTVRK